MCDYISSLRPFAPRLEVNHTLTSARFCRHSTRMTHVLLRILAHHVKCIQTIDVFFVLLNNNLFFIQWNNPSDQLQEVQLLKHG